MFDWLVILPFRGRPSLGKRLGLEVQFTSATISPSSVSVVHVFWVYLVNGLLIIRGPLQSHPATGLLGGGHRESLWDKSEVHRYWRISMDPPLSSSACSRLITSQICRKIEVQIRFHVNHVGPRNWNAIGFGHAPIVLLAVLPAIFWSRHKDRQGRIERLEFIANNFRGDSFRICLRQQLYHKTTTTIPQFRKCRCIQCPSKARPGFTIAWEY